MYRNLCKYMAEQLLEVLVSTVRPPPPYTKLAKLNVKYDMKNVY